MMRCVGYIRSSETESSTERPVKLQLVAQQRLLKNFICRKTVGCF